MIKKHIAELLITDIKFPNKGIGFWKDSKVVVKNTIPGQKIQARLSKKKGQYQGQKLLLLEKSEIEISPLCCDFGNCGGCTYQNIPYSEELKIKEKMVLELLEEAEINGFEYLGIEGASCTEGYRNKMEFSFGDEEKGGKLALGMRKRDSFYEVVTSRNCNIIDSDYRAILLAVLDFFQHSGESFYHKFTHRGALRHLIIRKGFFTGEILINLVTTDELSANINELAEQITALPLTGKISGILHTINNSVSDAIKCERMTTLYGRDYFMESLLGLSFKISPFSFFQTNSAGAEKLYTTVRDFTGDTSNKEIFDLYCGTGTIAQIVSQNAKQVTGVELVEEAVDAARENANLNQIENCRFISGDVLKVLDELAAQPKPDIIILDPPRDGIHPKALKKILDFGVPQIIYISCKASSLARDLQVFQEHGYKASQIKCHDLFPRTYHVETVALISRTDK